MVAFHVHLVVLYPVLLIHQRRCVHKPEEVLFLLRVCIQAIAILKGNFKYHSAILNFKGQDSVGGGGALPC